MAETCLLDTSALIAFTEEEPGADRVKALLESAARGESAVHGCFVSLTEIQYITTNEQGAEVARQTMETIKRLPITWHHSDDALCADAAELKSNHRLSFADAFVGAAAKRLNATLIHKDPEFASLAGKMQLEMLPPKNDVTGGK